MGCASSNEPKEGGGGGGGGAKPNGQARGGGAGGDVANENAAPEPAQPKQNPYLTLTPKDVFSLKMSYKGIRRSAEETGLNMFIKMFEANPDMKNYFEKFKGMDNEKLFKSTILQDHASLTMEMIDTFVTELDDADKTHAKIKKLGADHKKLGMKDEHLNEMRNPFLKAVEQTLGDRYTDRMRNIYEQFIDYVIKTMIEGYNS